MPLRIIAGFTGLSLFGLIVALGSKRLGYQNIEHIASSIGFIALLPVLLVVCILVVTALKDLVMGLLKK